MEETFRDKSTRVPSKAEVSRFRNSLKQNTCVEMLQEGYHRSFSELFSLLSCDRKQRETAEPGSALSLQTPLEEQRDKVETLRRHLSWAEQAERTGSWTVVCDQRLFLGRYFSAPEDLWISLHFYHSCADREHGGLLKPASEARACMAELYLQQGKLQQAKQQAELCMLQAENRVWLDSDGHPLKLRVRKTLWRICSRMADLLLDAEDYKEALSLLRRGHSMATEGRWTQSVCSLSMCVFISDEDKQMEAEAVYQLGLTYQRAGDHDNAKQFFNTCMQICSTRVDAHGLGKSYKAMARSLESVDNILEAVQCLEKLADISRSNGLQHNLADAYMCLGNIYYKRNQYMRASEYFLQGYEIACKLGDVAQLEKAQVMVASARAHCMIGKYSADVQSATPTALQQLLAWKETRGRQKLSANSTGNTDTAWY
uniref:tetratricopeptide repeat protein 29 n=1 Tax=Semicossyphus pulcher TaxID=241346 RepID=UPI0037E85A2D